MNGSTQLSAATRADVPPFHVMDLLALAAERQRTHGDLIARSLDEDHA